MSNKYTSAEQYEAGQAKEAIDKVLEKLKPEDKNPLPDKAKREALTIEFLLIVPYLNDIRATHPEKIDEYDGVLPQLEQTCQDIGKMVDEIDWKTVDAEFKQEVDNAISLLISVAEMLSSK